MQSKILISLVIIIIVLGVAAGAYSGFKAKVPALIPTIDFTASTTSPLATSSAPTTTSPIKNPPAGSTVMQLHQATTISGVTFTPKSVADSRCPTDVQCIWAGEVSLTLNIQAGNGTASNVGMKIGDTKIANSLAITLESVSPYPVSGHQITDSEYRFVFDIKKATPASSGGCFVGGCSGEICSDQLNAVSSCIYRESYACYKSATCERQANGQCGWTETSPLQQCIAAANNQ